MLLIDCRDSSVALDYTFVGGILADSLSVRLDSRGVAFGALALLWMLLQPFVELLGLALEPLDLALLTLAQWRFHSLCIIVAVPAQDLGHRLLHLLGLTRKVLALAALGLARVRRQLHPVHGKHLAPNE